MKSSRFSWSLPFLLFFLESDQKPDFEGRVGLFPGMGNGYVAGLDELEPIIAAVWGSDGSHEVDVTLVDVRPVQVFSRASSVRHRVTI
jgi:hypothetical protein